MLDKVLEAQKGHGVLAVMDQLTLPERFDRVFVAKDGRLAETSDFKPAAAEAAE